MPKILMALLALAALLTGQEPVDGYSELRRRGADALSASPRRIDEATTCYEQCLKLKPEDPFSLHQLACCHAWKGDKSTALSFLERSRNAHGVDPAYLDLLHTDEDLAPLHGDEQFERIRKDLEAAVELEERRILPPTFVLPAMEHVGEVTHVAFSPDGDRLYTGGGQGVLVVWDRGTHNLVACLTSGTELCVDADGMLYELVDRRLRWWDTTTFEQRGSAFFPMMEPFDVAARGDGRQLAIAGKRRSFLFDTSSAERSVLSAAWDADYRSDGRQIALVSKGQPLPLLLLHSTDDGKEVSRCQLPAEAFAVDFAPDSLRIACGCSDGSLLRIDLTKSPPEITSSRAHDGAINDVAYSPDGLRLVTTGIDESIRCWRAEAGDEQPLWEQRGTNLPDGKFRDEIYRVAFDRHGHIAVSTAEGKAVVLDASTGKIQDVYPGQPRRFRRLAIADGLLLCCDPDGVRPLALRSGKLADVRPPTTLVVERGRDDRPERLPLIQPPLESPEIALSGQGRSIEAAVVSPDGNYVCTFDFEVQSNTSERNVIQLWDCKTGRSTDLGLAVSYATGGSADLGRQVGRWQAASFSSDGKLLLTVQHEDSAARLWDVERAELLHHWPVPQQNPQAYYSTSAGTFDPTARRIAFGRNQKLFAANVADGKVLLESEPTGVRVDCVAFTPDGRRVVAGGHGKVFVWDLEEPKTLPATLLVPRPMVVRSVVCPTADRVAAQITDGRILLFSLPDQRLLATFTAEGKDWLCFTPDNLFDGSPDAIAKAVLVRNRLVYPLDCFTKLLHKPDLLQRALTGARVAPPDVPPPPQFVTEWPEHHQVVVDETQVKLRTSVADADSIGIDAIEVWQDDKPMRKEVVDKASRKAGAGLRLELPLTVPALQTTTVTLRATSRRGIKSRVETFRIQHQPKHRTLWVVPLAVADYEDPALDLRSSVIDALGMAARLRAEAPGLFDRVEVLELIGEKATVTGVQKTQARLQKEATSNDTVLVFVAGHGVRDDYGDYWFLTREATAADPSAGIKRRDIEELVTSPRLRAERRILMFDTCCAGGDPNVLVRGRSPQPFDKKELRENGDAKGVCILAAAAANEPAHETPQQGVFTRAVLDALAGAADGVGGKKDNQIDVDELCSFVCRVVDERTNGRQKPERTVGGKAFAIARVPAGK